VKRRTVALTSALIATGAIAATATANGPIGGNPVTWGPVYIGVEGPQSGSQSTNGQDQLRGVQLAVKQANAKGGINGRMIQIVTGNDQADPSMARSAARRIIGSGAVAVIGPYNSSVGVKNLPLYMRSKVVPFHLTSTDDTTGMGVTIQPKNSQISPVEFAWISEKMTPAKVSMLVTDSNYTQGMANRLEERLVKQGVLVTQIPVAEGQTSYQAQVQQALANNPTVVYLSTYFPEGAAIAKDLLATGNPAKCFAGLANQDPGFITRAGIPASQNCTFSGVPEPQQFPTARNYVKQYTAAFKKTPATWGTFTYDSANVLFTAMRKAKTTEYTKVLTQLKKTTNFSGATGKITINKNGIRPNVPVSILRVDTSGRFQVVTTIRGK
jgi:branched-chain amino acid transport system substrate-binding protein